MNRIIHFETFEDYGREIYLSIGCFPRISVLAFYASQFYPETSIEYFRTHAGVSLLMGSLLNINVQFMCWFIEIDLFKFIPPYEKYIYND